MNLIVNIGNTNITMALYNTRQNTAQPWGVVYRIPLNLCSSPEDTHKNIVAVIPPQYKTACAHIIICSVVPSITDTVSYALQSVFSTASLYHIALQPSLPIPTPPAELGRDLLANAISAWKKSDEHTATITADFGTALTCTATNSSGTIIGVSITPGITIAHEALVHHAAQLPLTTLSVPKSALGTTTESSINAGIMLGYVHLTRGILNQMKKELAEPVKLFATGGCAPLIAPACDIFDVIDLYHTLDGIRILAEFDTIIS